MHTTSCYDTVMATDTRRSLSMHAFGMIGVLALEYLFGMFTTLFVTFPQNEKEKQLWQFAWRQAPVAIHVILGFVLFAGTLALLIRALVKKETQWIISGTIATISVFAAIIAGALFIPHQTDWYSFIMAVSFIIALLAYFWGIYVTK